MGFSYNLNKIHIIYHVFKAFYALPSVSLYLSYSAPFNNNSLVTLAIFLTFKHTRLVLI